MRGVDTREAKRPLGTHGSKYPRDYELLTGDLRGERRAVLKGGPRRTAEGIEFQSLDDLNTVRRALDELASRWWVDDFERRAIDRTHNASREDC